MIFNAPVDVRAGNNRRKRLIQQMQARGSMRGSPGVARGAGASLLSRIGQTRRPVHPSLTNPHAYSGISEALRDALGIGGYGHPNASERSGGFGIPVPPPGFGVPEPNDPEVIPFDPSNAPGPTQPTGGGVAGLPSGRPNGPLHQGGFAPPNQPMQSPAMTTEAQPQLQPLAPGGGMSGLIPMGNGQYWDPQTNQIISIGGGQNPGSGFRM